MSYQGITKYYQYSVGERVLVNVSKLHDGTLVEKGTEFTIKSFPPKVRMVDYTDLSPKKSQYRYFVVGYTDNGQIVRLLMTEICKIIKRKAR